LSFLSAKVDCAAWRTALETWGEKVRRSSKTTPRRVRDVTLAIEGRGGEEEGYGRIARAAQKQ